MSRLHPDVIPSNRPRINVYAEPLGYIAHVTLATGICLQAFGADREDAIQSLEDEIVDWASVDLDDEEQPNWDLSEKWSDEEEEVKLILHFYVAGGTPRDLILYDRREKTARERLVATLTCIRDLLA